MLVGREHECAALDRLIERAQAGTAAALVILGEAGMGKTALLDHVAERAAGMTVVRAIGLESEAELEFSALFDVCRPLLEHAEALSVRQREALENALGAGSGSPSERFPVGAATLSLLAAAGEARPLLVLLDDAQWFDAASADALLFASRRLAAERVAMIFAARDDGDAFGGRALAAMRLGGVDARATATLIARRSGQVPSPDVAETIHRATAGNPLAIGELPELLTKPQLRGVEPIQEPMRVGPSVQRAFAERALHLSAPARQALLVAALSATSRAEPLVEALKRLDLSEHSLDAAEDAQLVSVADGHVRFRHPLIRSAVVQSAAAADRRKAHRALAGALAHRSDDERAWHLAAAALGPDEEAASALAELGARTRERSGWASAAIALERAARLTPDRSLAASRLLDAAEAAWVAGQTERTFTLTDELLGDRDGGAPRDAVVRLRSRLELHCGDVARAYDRLLEGASLFERSDPSLARLLLADAVEAAELLEAPQRALEACGRVGALAQPAAAHDRFATDLAVGQALRVAGRGTEARPRLEAALTGVLASDELQADMRACTRAAHAARWLGRVEDGLWCAHRAVELARAQEAFGPLAHALETTAALDADRGRWPEAYAHAAEGLDLASDTRCTWARTRCLELLAWLDAAYGNDERCREHADAAREVAAGAGLGSRRTQSALTLLELGLGHPEVAAELLGEGCSPGLDPVAGGDVVEALVRAGRQDDARVAFQQWPGDSRHPVRARCAGLLAKETEFDAPFLLALDLHPAHDAFGRARTELCFGERLRRAGRRVDARAHLRAAREGAERLGAHPWSERAAGELRATGERLGRREARRGDELTPQELQVALQAAEGKTNKEIGAALFLSPKTVDFHLRRVFRKLDVRSRGELIRHFAVAAR